MSEITIPERLAKRLDKVSETTGRRVDKIIREALEKQLDYEEWHTQAVHEGFASGDREGWLSHEESKKRLQDRIRNHKKAHRKAA